MTYYSKDGITVCTNKACVFLDTPTDQFRREFRSQVDAHACAEKVADSLEAGKPVLDTVASTGLSHLA